MAHALCMLDTYGYKHTFRIGNTPFPLQQWLHERASILRYMYIACLARSYEWRKSELLYTRAAWCRDEDLLHLYHQCATQLTQPWFAVRTRHHSHHSWNLQSASYTVTAKYGASRLQRTQRAVQQTWPPGLMTDTRVRWSWAPGRTQERRSTYLSRSQA